MASIGQLLAGGGVAKRVWDDQERAYRDDAYNADVQRLNVERGVADNALLGSRNSEIQARRGVNMDLMTEVRKDIPAASGIRRKRMQVEEADVDSQLATKDARAQTWKNQQEAARQQSELAVKQSGFQLEEWPTQLKQAKTQLGWDEVKTANFALAGIEMAISTGDGQALTSYVNGLLENGFARGFEGAKVKGVKMDVAGDQNGQPMVDPNTKQPIPVVVFTMEDGRQLALRRDKIQEAFKSMQPGELKEVGGVLVSVPKGGGPAREVFRAEEWKKLDDGALYNPATGQFKYANGYAGVKPEQARLLTNDGVNQIALAFGAKLDPIKQIIDTESIKDWKGYYAAIASAEQRIRAGEPPMKVASEIALQYKDKAESADKLETVAPKSSKSSPATDTILQGHPMYDWKD